MTKSRKVAEKPRTDSCAGCSKSIAPHKSAQRPGDLAVDIRIGAIVLSKNGKRPVGRPRSDVKDGFLSKERWGRMHLSCFLRSMESTDRFLEDFLAGTDVRQ